jgi:triosephosphate isomerase
MAKRNKWVAGNWKMNLDYLGAIALTNELLNHLPALNGTDVTLCVPSVYLEVLKPLVSKNGLISLAAQNCHSEDKGAFTGEISAVMLKSMLISRVVLGHSERREFFNESNEWLGKKVSNVLNHGLTPIFCCGEPLSVREANNQIDFVTNQLRESIFHLSKEQMTQLVLAYEPIWAIGTGRTASAEQAQEMHSAIRQFIAQKYGADIAQHLIILYGGSVNAANAASLFAMPDVDGGLVGGASLSAGDFLQIIAAAANS